MNDQPQQPRQKASRGSRTQGRNDGRDDDSGRDRDSRPKADPFLTSRFEELEKALHGTRTGPRRRALNWSWVNDTTKTFESIKTDLKVPKVRPSSDRPEESEASQSGG